jgi:acetolactate synthase-1/2/3 large subunit
MSGERGPGAELACRALELAGVRHVFGLPGTQNVPLFEALRRSRLTTIQATSELAATMMACGYARASGRLGVVAAIQGPGLAWAYAGIAEARHDSTPILVLTGTPADDPGHAFPLQAWDQAAGLRPVTKAVLRADSADVVPGMTVEAIRLALSDEPGPVVLELSPRALTSTAEAGPPAAPPGRPALPAGGVDSIVTRLVTAERPLLLAGQGALGAGDRLRALAERLGAPVVTSLSGRGALPDDHPLAVGHDLGLAVDRVNELVAEADLVVALGWKGTHNGTGGFRLRLPADRLVRVDTSAEVLRANYPAAVSLQADVPLLIEVLTRDPRLGGSTRPGWAGAGLEAARAQPESGEPEPRFSGLAAATPRDFFLALRAALPRDAIVVTDSGLHQALARRHLPVFSPRGFLAPSDFQSMGFGVPAAIGAALAEPGRAVVCVTGDGGFAMAGLELVTAVREGIPLLVVVFNDGHLGLIRRQQFREHGHAHAVDVGPVNYAALAAALGAAYVLLEGSVGKGVAAALEMRRPVLVEAVLGDTAAFDRVRARGAAREAVRRVIPTGLLGWIRRRLG